MTARSIPRCQPPWSFEVDPLEVFDWHGVELAVHHTWHRLDGRPIREQEFIVSEVQTGFAVAKRRPTVEEARARALDRLEANGPEAVVKALVQQAALGGLEYQTPEWYGAQGAEVEEPVGSVWDNPIPVVSPAVFGF